MTKQLLYSLGIIFSLTTSLFAASEKYEFIVAEVGEEIIMYSEIGEAMNQLSSVPGYAGLPYNLLQQKVLDRMIDDKVILNKAKEDSLEISEAEVNSRIDRHILGIAERQGTDVKTIIKAIEQQTGSSIAEYRKTLFKQIKDQGTLQQVQMKYIGRVQPTRKEVENFYSEYKDSLPKLKNAVRVAHIQRKVRASVAMVDSVYKVGKSIIELLDKGMKFDELAKKYSQDDSAEKGGDIGFYRQGSLDKEYEKVAFKLELGKYHDYPVKTRIGYHIIKKLAERDKEVRSAHILLRVVPTAKDTLMVKTFLDSLKKDISKDPKPLDKFMNLARKYSDDEEVKINNGDLGWFQFKDMDKSYASFIENLEVGQMTDVVQIDDDWHVFYLAGKEDSKTLNLEDNYTEIENMAIGIFSNRKLEKFVKQWRENIYIDIRWKPGQEK